jgi:hypothetical protein
LRDGHRSPAGRGTDMTRRYRGHARPRAGFHNASWRTVSWVRVTGWHANDRTRVLPRLNAQPEPRAVLARAPRDLPCSPRESCRPGERGPLLVTELLAVPMLLIHAISEWPPKPPPSGTACPRPTAPPRPRPPAITRPPPRPSPGGAGYLPRHAAAECRRGTAVNTARPPRRPRSVPPAGPRRKCSANGPEQPQSRRG